MLFSADLRRDVPSRFLVLPLQSARPAGPAHRACCAEPSDEPRDAAIHQRPAAASKMKWKPATTPPKISWSTSCRIRASLSQIPGERNASASRSKRCRRARSLTNLLQTARARRQHDASDAGRAKRKPTIPQRRADHRATAQEATVQARARHLHDSRIPFRDAMERQRPISATADRADSAAQYARRRSAGGRLRRARSRLWSTCRIRCRRRRRSRSTKIRAADARPARISIDGTVGAIASSRSVHRATKCASTCVPAKRLCARRRSSRCPKRARAIRSN